jgi:nitrite reductase/ring-hydroxylating ferredoxin subunit
MTSDVDRWFAVARSEEVIHGHLVQTQLLAQELVLWRDDTGGVNAWANRCPHRGVRLSIGINAGAELRCRYHGWRFAAGTGQCTFIPAHPTQKPASTVHADVHSAVERHGYVWVTYGRAPEPPLPFMLPGSATTLRSIFVNAPAVAVAAGLLQGYSLEPLAAVRVTALDEFTLSATDGVMFLLQPVTGSQTIIHGFTSPRADAADRIAVMRRRNAQLSRLRDTLELAHAAGTRAP